MLAKSSLNKLICGLVLKKLVLYEMTNLKLV